MKTCIIFFITSFLSLAYGTEALKTHTPKTFSKFMKAAIEAKDAPAACWYLGTAQGYLRALKDSGNQKATQLLTAIKDGEGKCGGKNSMDLKTTFTPEEWSRLSSLQQKIESTEL